MRPLRRGKPTHLPLPLLAATPVRTPSLDRALRLVVLPPPSALAAPPTGRAPNLLRDLALPLPACVTPIRPQAPETPSSGAIVLHAPMAEYLELEAPI